MAKQFDIKQTGLKIFFKEWQIPIVKLIDGDTITETNPLRSLNATIHTNKIIPKEKNISRPSVIFFLRDLKKAGWLDSREEPGRGGYHNLYWKKFPLSEFIDMRIRSLSGGLG